MDKTKSRNSPSPFTPDNKSVSNKLLYGFAILIALFFIVTFTVFFSSSGTYDFTFILLFCALSMIGAIVLVKKEYYTIAKFIISVVPTYTVIIVSVLAKNQDVTNSHFLYLAPRTFTILFLMAPIIFFGLRQTKSMIVALVILLPPVLLFDYIHSYFGVGLTDLKFDPEHYFIFLGLITVFYSIVLISLLFFQKLTLLYHLKLSDQSNKIIKDHLAIEKMNNKLDYTLSELNKSISYASSLQKALLPHDLTINKFFKNSAFLYLPKDIVSGDFYFAHELQNYLYFGVGDCVGHGIPGAFLTSMSIEAVRSTINTSNGALPDAILESLREIAINRYDSNLIGEYSESMDAGVCLYNRTDNKFYFSGGRINLYVVDTNSEIHTYEGTKCPVGDYVVQKNFILHEIDLKPGDTIYLATDGYFDQFGIDKSSNKVKPQKFKRIRFLDTIKEIHKLDSHEQTCILREKMQDWKGSLDQIDDITVMIAKH